MLFTYRSTAKWNNSVWFQLLIAALIWIPLSALLIRFAVRIADIKTTLLFFSLLLYWAISLINRARLTVRFPAVELSSTHLVLNRPMSNRTVYNLAEVKGAKFIGNTLYFCHLGWPVVTPLGSMPKEKQMELLQLLTTRHESPLR